MLLPVSLNRFLAETSFDAQISGFRFPKNLKFVWKTETPNQVLNKVHLVVATLAEKAPKFTKRAAHWCVHHLPSNIRILVYLVIYDSARRPLVLLLLYYCQA